METFCSPYFDDVFLIIFFIVPLAFIIEGIIVYIVYKMKFIEYFGKVVLSHLSIVKIYLIGIPIIFFLSIVAVYVYPDNLSATGAETISNPLLRAIYIALLFSLVWPLMIFVGGAMDSLIVVLLFYSLFKDIVCLKFIVVFGYTQINLLDIILAIFSPMIIFLNSAIYYLIGLTSIMTIRNKRENKNHKNPIFFNLPAKVK